MSDKAIAYVPHEDSLNKALQRFDNKEIVCITASIYKLRIKFATGEVIEIPSVSKVLITQTKEYDL